MRARKSTASCQLAETANVMLLALAWPIFISSALAFQAIHDACRRLAAGAAFGGSSGIDWVRLRLDLALARAVEEEDYERAAQVQADLALLQRCQTEELATELLRRCKGMHSDWSKNVARTARDS